MYVLIIKILTQTLELLYVLGEFKSFTMFNNLFKINTLYDWTTEH